MGLKEKRQARKAARKAIRAKRSKNFDKVKAMFEKLKEPKEGATREEKFKAYWPFFASALQFLIDLRITRKRADLKLEEMLDWGNSVMSGEPLGTANAFAKRFEKAWKGIRFILNLASIVRHKWDTVIDKIIDIGDFLTGMEDSPEEDMTA